MDLRPLRNSKSFQRLTIAATVGVDALVPSTGTTAPSMITSVGIQRTPYRWPRAVLRLPPQGSASQGSHAMTSVLDHLLFAVLALGTVAVAVGVLLLPVT